MIEPSMLFSESDLERIKQAVHEAEHKTSGEIVPYVVRMSDTYEIAEWRAGVLCAVLALGGFIGVRQFSESWLPFDFVEMAIVVMASIAAGALATHFIPALQRWFTGKDLMGFRTQQRAMQAFVSEEVFATKDRTGILIFLSLLEHKVIVLGDAGINAKVSQKDWEGIVSTITSAVMQGKPADGLIAAINECGRLLERYGVQRRHDDRDELSGDLRVGDSNKP